MPSSVPGMPPLVRSGTARGVATVTLDSPANRNALSSALIAQLLDALAAVDAAPDVRAVVLTHTGPVFCSGADLKETASSSPAGRLGAVLDAIWTSPKPVVARVAGPARAGGLGLIAAADIAVCVADATFAFSEVRIGVIPAVISATVLPRLSSRAAAELYLTGNTFDGTRAAAVGLVTAAVAAAELDTTVDSYVKALIRGAPGALAGTKELLRGGRGLDTAALTETSVRYFTSPEAREGIAAFREKRDPAWVPPG